MSDDDPCSDDTPDGGRPSGTDLREDARPTGQTPDRNAVGADDPRTDPTGTGSDDVSSRADQVGPDAPGGDPAGDGNEPPANLRTQVLQATLAVLAVVAVATLYQFYVHSAAAIDVWIGDRYRSTVLAAFNLAVLLSSSAGVSLVVRELTESG